MNDAAGTFLHSYLLDGNGGARAVDEAAVQHWMPEQGILWVHLDATHGAATDWLQTNSGLSEIVVEAMFLGEARARTFSTDHGLFAAFRGVNGNPGENPEDMVAVRLWIEKNRIITIRRRRIFSVQDVRASLDEGKGPSTTGEFLAELVERLANRIGEFVDDIEDRIGEIEDRAPGEKLSESRLRLSDLRRQIAAVRRFLAPQRDALDRLYRQPGDWLSSKEIQHFREEADRITRYLEDIDLARERAVLLQEEFLSQMAQEQNTRMYVLSVVAAIFLPLTFVTGLLGMNVGGLPGLENPRGFFVSVGLMLVVSVALAIYFRWKKWI